MAGTLRETAARRLPAPVVAKLARARRMVRETVLRSQRRRRPPGSFSLSLGDTLNLLYPGTLPTDLHLDERALRVAGSLRVRDLPTIRRILSALDGPSAPSPVQIRFGPTEVAAVDADGIRLLLDRADGSVAQEILQGPGYEPEVTRALAAVLRPGMTFLDVGANVGYHALRAARLVGPTGRVIAVEPVSENCRAILMSIHENGLENVSLLPVALDDHRGWAHLSAHVGTNASFISPTADELARGYGTIVPTFPLDDLVTGPVDVMKIDVEGAEWRAVAGARRVITGSLPVVVTEVSEEMLGRVSGSAIDQYVGWFASLGYSVSLLDRRGGAPVPIPDVDRWLSEWGDPLRVENLLLVPPGSGETEAP